MPWGHQPASSDDTTCAWTWQFELGNIWCTNQLHAIDINRYHTSLAICTILSERSEGGQPLGQRITRPRKSNNLTLRKDKTCPWRGQFELGNTWCTNKLSITDACTGWNPASGGYGMPHRPLWCLFTHTTDHMSLWHLYMFTLASVADPRLFDPRVGDDKTYITTMGMQQTSVHGRTT